jgi:hypothetical protein
MHSISDCYHDNLLSSDKKRNVITRASILQTIGKTEENAKDGLSVEDALPFLVKYRLRLRVVDKFCKLVFKRDPSARNRHNKPMCCVMTDGHTYTLNHELKRMEQLQGGEEE